MPVTLHLSEGRKLDILDAGFRMHFPRKGSVALGPLATVLYSSCSRELEWDAVKYVTDNLARLTAIAISDVVDLTHLSWSLTVNGSTDGILPKTRDGDTYYKCSAYERGVGFYGQEAVTEGVVSKILDSVGIPHLHYDVVLAKIIMDGNEYTTPVCISKDFNPSSLPSVSFERYFGHRPSELELAQAGMLKYVYFMRVADFLIGNIDRHGANVEIVDGRPAPLFDHGCSLLMLNAPAFWDHWSRDNVQTCCGSRSLKQNLLTVPKDLLRTLCQPDLLLCESLFWEKEYTSATKKMIEERWKAIKELM